MNDYIIPSNFEEGGKLMGVFGVRNVIEAGILSLPFIYLVFMFVPLGLTWKIILAATVVIPVGGFALIGINDDPLSIFVKNWWCWLRNKRIMEYRGEVK